MNPLVGQTLGGTYRVERLIGKGGMGAVYEASHQRLSRSFALKVLAPDLTHHREALSRFRQEAQITSSLGHPNIVEVVDFNEIEGGAPYFVMELLSGEDLSDRVARGGPMAVADVAAVLCQLTSALHSAHEHGVIHRDLKPQNVFLAQREGFDDVVKVVDFGISKVLGAQAAMTGNRAMLGTPAYMSPEQAREESALVDARSDVYAVGAIAYECLAGHPPFTGETISGLIYKVLNEEPESLSALRDDLPAALVEVVEGAMAKDPQGRFGDMAKLWQACHEALASILDRDRPVDYRWHLRHLDEATSSEEDQGLDGARVALGSASTVSNDALGSASTVSNDPLGSASTLSADAVPAVASVNGLSPSRGRLRWLPLGVAAMLLLGGGLALSLWRPGGSETPAQPARTPKISAPEPKTKSAASRPASDVETKAPAVAQPKRAQTKPKPRKAKLPPKPAPRRKSKVRRAGNAVKAKPQSQKPQSQKPQSQKPQSQKPKAKVRDGLLEF